MRIKTVRRAVLTSLIVSLLTLLTACQLWGAVSNTLTIREASGQEQRDYPVQIGRPFVCGEIQDSPQAVLDGIATETQATVKNRCADGSVKFAILHFYVPKLKPRASVQVSFVNQKSGNDSAAPDHQEILKDKQFDATMVLKAGGKTHTASARTMVKKGAFIYWARGNLTTSLIVADHSVDRKFDIGFDNHRSVRPIFHVTYWPKIKKTHVRFIGEIANTETLQDQRYALELKVGRKRKPVYQIEFTHTAMSRWTRTAWVGGEPTEVEIDHNREYLAETRYIYNFDFSKRIPGGTLARAYDRWIAVDKDLGDAGIWWKNMHSAGGREDIGPFPSWVVRYLYSMDNRARAQMIGQAELGGAWPFHLREGKTDSSLGIDREIESSKLGLGQILCVENRPTLGLWNPESPYTKEGERIIPVGTMTDDGWWWDNAHAPDAWTVPYLITGEFWYLEELQFYAAAQTAAPPGAARRYDYGRGPTGREGAGDLTQIRGWAWQFRNRLHAGLLSPDNSPEKLYFEFLIGDAIGAEEGARGIRGTAYEDSDIWKWGAEKRRPPQGFPPLNQWARGGVEFVQPDHGPDPEVVGMAIPNWEQHILILVLGRGKELGYPTGPLLSYVAKNLIGQLTAPDYNPYLVESGRQPTVRRGDGKYFDSWQSLRTGYLPDWQNKSSFNLVWQETYSIYAMAAAAMVADEPGGAAAWKFMKEKLLDVHPGLPTDPKWCIVPRPAENAKVKKVVQFRRRGRNERVHQLAERKAA